MINTIIKILSAFFIFALAFTSIAAANDDLIQDGRNCEFIAKHYAAKYNMDMYVIVPLKDNGAYELSDYGMHMINSKIINGKRYYFNFGGFQIIQQDGDVMLYGNYIPGDSIFQYEEQIKNFYKSMTGKDSTIYSVQNVPFPIIWHY